MMEVRIKRDKGEERKRERGDGKKITERQNDRHYP